MNNFHWLLDTVLQNSGRTSEQAASISKAEARLGSVPVKRIWPLVARIASCLVCFAFIVSSPARCPTALLGVN